MHRMLGISYKSTWFMMHRLREAMRVGGLAPLGGSGKAVESDETFIGRLEGQPKRRGGGGRAHKNTVLTLVERRGSARSFHVDGSRFADIAPIVRENIKRETTLMTRERITLRSAKSSPSMAQSRTVTMNMFATCRVKITCSIPIRPRTIIRSSNAA